MTPVRRRDPARACFGVEWIRSRARESVSAAASQADKSVSGREHRREKRRDEEEKSVVNTRARRRRAFGDALRRAGPRAPAESTTMNAKRRGAEPGHRA